VRKSAFCGIGAFFLLLMISGWAGYSRYEPKPPKLELIVDQKAVIIEPMTYSLQKWGRAAAADTYSEPAELVKKDTPISINTSEQLKLKFEDAPESVKYYLWDINTGKLAYKDLKGYPLKLKNSNVASGDYAMEIRAKWENGYVLYNTRIAAYNDEK
jgi:hypothetical protein